MKTRLLSLVTVMLIGAGAMAQSNTMVMLEEGTQASCPPCASQNPPYNAMIADNSDKVVAIAYQVWWPGFDPMYLDNPSEVEDRIDYYGISGVPEAEMNGSPLANDCGAYDGAPACLDQDDIDAAWEVISPFTMTLEADAENTMLNVTGNIYCDSDQGGDLRLRVALTEKLITIEDAPGGTNGETEYHHVMKKFLGDGTDGTELGEMVMGDSYDFNFTLDLGTVNIYNYDQLEVVAWIQNDDNKDIYQAAKDQEVEFTVDFANNAALPAIGVLPAGVCAGEVTISPEVKLFNSGNDDLTSCDIVYSINGGTEQTFNWTGNLTTFGSEWVTLDPYTFDAPSSGESTLNAMVTNPNGMMDEDSSDDAVEGQIPAAPGTVNHLHISILTDGYGDEVYWEVRSADGTIIEWGGNPNVGLDNIGTGTFPPPPDPNMYANNTQYDIYVTLPEGTDCYTFHLTDYYGDGVSLGGNYAIYDNDGNQIGSEDYTDEVMHDFSAESNGINVDEIDTTPELLVAPNPATDVLNLTITSLAQSNLSVEIINAQGQLVHTEVFNSQSKDFNAQIDVSDLADGVYFVNLLHEAGVETSKIVIRK